MGSTQCHLKKCCRWLVASALFATYNGVALSVVPDNPNYVGPKECPNDASTEGYDNTTTLYFDMLLINNEAASGKIPRDKAERIYTLCPKTFFQLGGNFTNNTDPQHMAPLVPFLENTVFRCGKNGAAEDECVMQGGWNHILFEDDFHWAKNITVSGIKFEESEWVSVFALGHPLTDMTFINCTWQNNLNGDFVVLSAWDKDLKFFYERRLGVEAEKPLVPSFDVPEIKLSQLLSPRSSTHLSNIVARRELHDTIDGAMYTEFVNCRFVDNNANYAIIFNEGGYLELNSCSFWRNKAPVIIGNSRNSSLSIYGGTSFYDNSDELGPIFLSETSNLTRYDNDTTGKDHIGGTGCDGVFIRSRGGSCPVDNPSECEGICCEFGNSSCPTGSEGKDVQPHPHPKPSKPTTTSEETKCGSFCMSLAVIIPVAFIVVAGLACSAYRTRQQVMSANQASGEGGEGCELEQTKAGTYFA